MSRASATRPEASRAAGRHALAAPPAGSCRAGLLRAFDPRHPAGRRGCTLASGALLALAARPWGVGWLAAVALVPLLASLRREPRPLAAALQAGGAMLAPAFVAYEAVGPLAPAALAPLALAATAPFAAAAAMAPRLRRAVGARGLLLAFPLLWVAAETLPGRAWLLGRYATPLLALGYTQAGLPAMQLARLGGVEGVSLALLTANALLALAVTERARWALPALAVLALGVAGAAWPRPAASEPGTVAVRVVQEALPDAAYAVAAVRPEARAALVGAFVRDSLAAPMPAGPGLTVWPEGALPGPLPAAGPSGLEPLLGPLGPTLAGAPARVAGGVANAAYAWQHGALRHVYDKRRLVPSSEGGLVPGTALGVTALGGVRVAPLICFEAAFPALARRAAAAGAELLAVLTNDGFGRALGTPLQHLRVARFRAVETGLPLAFASNAGPSAVVDGRGRVLARTRPNAPAVVVATPRLAAGPTPYLRWGDWPGTLALAGAGLLALVSGAKGGRPRS